MTVFLFLLAGLVITTPQGTLLPTASTQSFVTGPPTATTMIVSALHPSNAGKTRAQCTIISVFSTLFQQQLHCAKMSTAKINAKKKNLTLLE